MACDVVFLFFIHLLLVYYLSYIFSSPSFKKNTTLGGERKIGKTDTWAYYEVLENQKMAMKIKKNKNWCLSVTVTDEESYLVIDHISRKKKDTILNTQPIFKKTIL